MGFYEELAEYTGKPLPLVRDRCNYARFELAWRWPDRKSDSDFYGSTDLYLFDLTMYAEHLKERGTYRWFRQMLKDKKIEVMVDYGGGIGEYSIIAEEEGIFASHLDLEGPLNDYAEWRFKKRKLNIDMYEPSTEFTADLYVCMDVFEHIADPKPVIESIAKKCKYIMCNPEEIPYNLVYPQHISRFDLTPYFKKIDKYLWQSTVLAPADSGPASTTGEPGA